MRGSVVGNPEHSASGAVGLLAHDLRDQALEWSDSGLVLAPSEQLGTMNVPGREVCPGALACIFMLDVSGASWGRRQGAMRAASGLNAGLLVGAKNVIARRQNSAFPATLVEVQNGAGLGGEVRVAWEYPAAMAPGPQCVLAEPAPQRGAADLGDNAVCDRLAPQLGNRPARQRQPTARGQFTSQCLDLDNHIGGKSGRVARPAAALRVLISAGYRTLAPFADDLTWRIEPGSDSVV